MKSRAMIGDMYCRQLGGRYTPHKRGIASRRVAAIDTAGSLWYYAQVYLGTVVLGSTGVGKSMHCHCGVPSRAFQGFPNARCALRTAHWPFRLAGTAGCQQPWRLASQCGRQPPITFGLPRLLHPFCSGSIQDHLGQSLWSLLLKKMLQWTFMRRSPASSACNSWPTSTV